MAVMKAEGRRPGVILYSNTDNYPLEIATMVEQEGAAACWDVREMSYFVGCEDDNVIYLGPGFMEAFTRAKLHLSIVLFWHPDSKSELEGITYDTFSAALQKAESLGLVEDVTVMSSHVPRM